VEQDEPGPGAVLDRSAGRSPAIALP
jgi:hypothetical protein